MIDYTERLDPVLEEENRERAVLRRRLIVAMGIVGVDDPRLKRAFLSDWAENLFDPDYHASTQRYGVDGYLTSRYSLNRVWGAAALLDLNIRAAEATDGGVPQDQLDRVGDVLASAAQMRREMPYGGRDESLELIAQNVDVLAGVMSAVREVRE